MDRKNRNIWVSDFWEGLGFCFLSMHHKWTAVCVCVCVFLWSWFLGWVSDECCHGKVIPNIARPMCVCVCAYQRLMTAHWRLFPRDKKVFPCLHISSHTHMYLASLFNVLVEYVWHSSSRINDFSNPRKGFSGVLLNHNHHRMSVSVHFFCFSHVDFSLLSLLLLSGDDLSVPSSPATARNDCSIAPLTPSPSPVTTHTHLHRHSFRPHTLSPSLLMLLYIVFLKSTSTPTSTPRCY